jgi:hypothetical protein
LLQVKNRKPRKKFVSSEDQRLIGTDFEQYRKKRTDVKEQAPSKWRQQHDQFLAIAQANKPANTGPASAASTDGTSAAMASVVASHDHVSAGAGDQNAVAVGGGDATQTVSETPVAVAAPPAPKLHRGDKVVLIDKGIVGYVHVFGGSRISH